VSYLITGASGMLGTDLVGALTGRSVTALSRAQLDITDAAAVDAAVAGHDVVINTAAYTRVDDAETHEDDARRINALGAGLLAAAAARHGARLVHLSTDYVFDGTATVPYAEDAPRHPVSAYGRSKAEGEEAVLAAHSAGTYLVRTAWLYGAHGANFAKTIRRLLADRDTVSVVTDQIGQPTWTVDLAQRIVALLDADAPVGIYHGTSSGEASWFDFARAVVTHAGLDADRITPTDSSAFVRPAPRPAYSVLGHDRWASAGVSPIRGWQEALAEAHTAGATDPAS
jgi:dTDP-4-dehydrorhamnose reductase